VKQLLVRADATVAMGTGHVMRCFALAQVWQATGGTVTFLSRCESPALRRRVRDEGIRLASPPAVHPDPRDWEATARLVKRLKPDWLVLDGYHFDTGYQQAARDAGVRVMVTDDLVHWPRYHADVLLNQNLGAGKLSYNCDPDTRMLLGPRYALLRTEFLEWRRRRRRIPKQARKVLVTMGGSDPKNVTLKVIRILKRVPVVGLEAVVMVGAGNPHLDVLKAEVQQPGVGGRGPGIRFAHAPENVAELMAWADLAVSAGGSTCWELVLMGLPSLVLVVADNQRGVAAALDTAGAARRTTLRRLRADIADILGRVNERRSISERGREMVDGGGGRRVVTRLKAAAISLRRAHAEDGRLVWQWRNDRETRAASFRSGRLPWSDHVKWFLDQVESPQCLFYIAVNSDSSPIGQVRCDSDGKTAVISAGLAKEARGCGYGAALVLRGSEQCFIDSPVERIHAYIKPQNLRSLRAFQAAGYVRAGMTRVQGESAHRLVLCRRDLQ